MLAIIISRPYGLNARRTGTPPDDLSNVSRSEYHWKIFNQEDCVILASGRTDKPITVTYRRSHATEEQRINRQSGDGCQQQVRPLFSSNCPCQKEFGLTDDGT